MLISDYLQKKLQIFLICIDGAYIQITVNETTNTLDS